MPDGSVQQRDVRTIPFFRFEDNEAHTIPLYGFKFGNDSISRLVRGDRQHPFIVRNLRVWETHYNLQPSLAYFLLDGLKNIETALPFPVPFGTSFLALGRAGA